MYLFLLLQFTSQALLMAEGIGSFRTLLRAAGFLSSIAMLVLLPVHGARHHPARSLTIALLIVTATGMIHSESVLLSGFAHWWLVLSIWAPLLWIGRIAITTRTIERVFGMVWMFHVASSIVGVLQVYYPERFAPSAEFVRSLLGDFADGLLIDVADGRKVFRPFGLSDTPGGAATSGLFAVILGLFMISSVPGIVVRVVASAGIVVGAFCIYVSEVRSVMIVTVLSIGVITVVQYLQGKSSRALITFLVIPFVVVATFGWSSSVTGPRVANRIKSLTEGSASNVYYRNRGKFVEHAITDEIPRYPLGAGLGRYGMMFVHFGDKRMRDARPLWVEIQMSAWLYDGGLLLIIVGYGAVLCVCVTTLRMALRKGGNRSLADYACLLSGLNAGWLAVTFNYPLFLGQGGIMFCVLNAALYAAAARPSNPASSISRAAKCGTDLQGEGELSRLSSAER